MKKLSILAILILFTVNIYSNPLKIILIIGDGMGLSHAYAGLTWNGGKSSLERSHYIGLCKTYSASNYVTDSGASGTAIATGYKSYNHAIGIDKDSVSHKNLLDIAIEQNKSTAIIVTSAITHATPACFLAHNNERYNEEDIAEEIVNSKADILIGGGEKFFNNRKDKQDILSIIKTNDFHVISYKDFNIKNLLEVNKYKHNKYMIFTDSSSPKKYIDGRGDILTNGFIFSTRKFADNNDGFFMMIESSQIDWACHNNDAKYLRGEMEEFEKLVKLSFDYADSNPNTLVIITADHETGGLAVETGDFKNKIANIDFTSNVHTGVWVPVYAYGKNAEIFTGIYENTDIFKKIKKLLEQK